MGMLKTEVDGEWVPVVPPSVVLPPGGGDDDVLVRAGEGSTWASLTRVLVLDAEEPVPEGTSVGTVILRRES